MATIRISHLTFAYDAEDLFVDFSLNFDTDWKTGLIGRNGRGKTTLLRLLMGELRPQDGVLEAPVLFDHFPFALTAEQLAGDAALAGRDIEPWQLERELRLLGVDAGDVLYRPIETLSGGERTKLQLAALFARSDHFLLIDEPTDHLDTTGRALVGDYLHSKKGFLLVSHDRAFLDRSIDHIISLNKSGPVVEQGNHKTFSYNQRHRDENDIEKNALLGKEIERLEGEQQQRRGWANAVEKTKSGASDKGRVGHLSAKAMKRALVIQARAQKAIDEKKELLKDIEYASELKLAPLHHIKDLLIAAQDLSLGYDRPLFAHLRFELRQGERLAITGANGCGKTTLLKAVLGEMTPLAGALAKAPHLRISHVAQETAHLSGTPVEWATAQGVDITKFLMLLRKLDFRRAAFEQDMRLMSEGQKKKVLLAASLSESAHLYVWDEPMNYVDMPSREQVENLIAHSDATFLLVEHDARFLEHIGATTLHIDEDVGGNI